MYRVVWCNFEVQHAPKSFKQNLHIHGHVYDLAPARSWIPSQDHGGQSRMRNMIHSLAQKRFNTRTSLLDANNTFGCALGCRWWKTVLVAGPWWTLPLHALVIWDRPMMSGSEGAWEGQETSLAFRLEGFWMGQTWVMNSLDAGFPELYALPVYYCVSHAWLAHNEPHITHSDASLKHLLLWGNICYSVQNTIYHLYVKL